MMIIDNGLLLDDMKALPETMQTYWYLNPWEQMSMD